MDVVETIKNALDNMKGRRFFVSEADFQASLTWELAKVFQDSPNVKIYREFPVRVYDTRWHTIYIDILVVADGKKYPIELKYKTDKIESDALYEDTGIPIKDILKSQAAHDVDSYDCWKDISRIEKLVDSGFAQTGVFICIANDKYYWNGNCGENTLGYAFRMNPGIKRGGEYNWNFANCTIPEKLLKTRPNLRIKNDYEFVWRDFYEIPAKNGKFMSMVVEIPATE